LPPKYQDYRQDPSGVNPESQGNALVLTNDENNQGRNIFE
jgi:hypothetical protein